MIVDDIVGIEVVVVDTEQVETSSTGGLFA